MQNKSILKSFFLILTAPFLLPNSAASYTNLTVEEVYIRLAMADTLLLLDVRESNEYVDGHIAEPAGQLPLTPVHMALNSGVLSNEHARLPRDIDIIVYCRSGSRSARASSLLESNGFTRIFNMLGGFSSWTHEKRNGGYGDHSGQWISLTDIEPTEIKFPIGGDTSKVLIAPTALSNSDESIYVELHFASYKLPLPQNVPSSSFEGLYRLTVLDQFGLSKFKSDSLAMSDSIAIKLFPQYVSNKNVLEITNHDLKIYTLQKGWQAITYNFSDHAFHSQGTILRQWYNTEVYLSPTKVTSSHSSKTQDIKIYPNPFNSMIQINAPHYALIHVYDVRGRLIQQIENGRWIPSMKLVSGTFFITIQHSDNMITKKITYLK